MKITLLYVIVRVTNVLGYCVCDHSFGNRS